MAGKKGFVTFFLNICDDNKHIPIEEYIGLVRTQNQPVVDALAEEGYLCVFVPCFDEACRVEKRNFIKDTTESERDVDDDENDKKREKKRSE